MENDEIAKIFLGMADLLELQNIKWKPQAYRAAAASIQGLSEPVSETYKKGGLKALDEIPNVGEGIAKKVAEFVKTGRVRAFERLRKEAKLDVEDLGRVHGLGPKKMKLLFNKLGVRNIAGLRNAAKRHRIRSLRGFGEKSEKAVLKGINHVEEEGRIPLERALPVANAIKSGLQKCSAVLKVEIAGSLRRKKPTVHDIDVLVATNKPEQVMGFFTRMKQVKEVLMKGKTKSSVKVDGVQVDLRAVKPEQWGSALLYFTGSKQHNIELRRIAQKKGWKISEYGLFKGSEILASKTEKAIYNKLGLLYVPPTERENRGEIEKAMRAFGEK